MFLYNIIIGPIILILNIVYSFFFKLYANPYVALITLSIFVSTVTLPLYTRADYYQRKDMEQKRSMDKWVTHIRKTFKGDERYFMLSAYYKENDYKPIYALRSTISIFLQIPFFLSAYHYLSSVYENASSDYSFLSHPDALINIGGISINLLPIVMTAINLVSGFVYSKGMKFKEKWQIFLLPLVFLVLLYNSPAALLIYWTSNNVYSLLKNVIYALPEKPKSLVKKGIALILVSYVGISVIGSIAYSLTELAYFKTTIVHIATYVSDQALDENMTTILVLIGTLSGLIIASILAYMIYLYMKSNGKIKLKDKTSSPINVAVSDVILLETVLFLFMGLVIPLNLISTSPTEFATTLGGIWLILKNSVYLYLGMFLVWVNVFFFLINKRRDIFAMVLMFVTVSSLIYYYTSPKWGDISVFFEFDVQKIEITRVAAVISEVIPFVLIIVLYLLRKPLLKNIKAISAVLVIIFVAMIGINVYKTAKAVNDYNKSVEAASKDSMDGIFSFSTEGNNVVLIMLDRATGAYLPYIFDEQPELQEKFDGFTYYPNTLSFGRCTNFASPALFGGYEYRPAEMNKRDTEKLAVKHNEAIKVLPDIFYNNGYNVVLSDVPYPGYTWDGDLSIFSEYPGMTTVKGATEAVRTDTQNSWSKEICENVITYQKNALPYFSVMETMPIVYRMWIYEQGSYLNSAYKSAFSSESFKNYTELDNLPQYTSITDDSQDNYIELVNLLTHEPCELQMPDYTMEKVVDNYAYNPEASRNVNGEIMLMGGSNSRNHYAVNFAAIRMLGEWFDYLREMGVYDNTRIIIASDHGPKTEQFPPYYMDDGVDIISYNCLFMVKDFNSTGWTVDEQFMTNADAPTILTDSIIENPTNPFTGNPITSDPKYNREPMLVTVSDNGMYLTDTYTFDVSDWPAWYDVHDNVFDTSNWVLVNP